MLGHSIVSQHFKETEFSPSVPILSQTKPVPITTSHLSKILPNIIHPIRFSARGPLSLVSTTEELLDRKVAAPV
jgi:hypothetical protein